MTNTIELKEKRRLIVVVKKLIPLQKSLKIQIRLCNNDNIREILLGIENDLKDIEQKLATENINYVESTGDRLF